MFGSRSLKAADLMQNLATVLDGQGRLTEARDLLGIPMYVCMYVFMYVYIFMHCIETVCIEEALSIQEESHPGEVSMETAVTLNNLGVVNAHIGNNMYVCMYVCMYTKR